jgi:hypothetical protein
MDDLKLLRNMRADVPPPSPQAFAAAEQRLAKAARTRQRSPFRLVTGGRVPALPGRMGRLAIAGGLSLAVAAGVAAYEAQTVRTVPGHHHVTFTAWTVVRHPDGLVLGRVRELRDAAGLQARLRSYGVPARVEFVRHPFHVTTSPRDLPRSCAVPDLSDKPAAMLQSKILPQYPAPGKNGLSRSIPGLVLAIRPSAIPDGIGVFFKVWAPVGAQWELNLVETSPRCTG